MVEQYCLIMCCLSVSFFAIEGMQKLDVGGGKVK